MRSLSVCFSGNRNCCCSSHPLRGTAWLALSWYVRPKVRSWKRCGYQGLQTVGPTWKMLSNVFTPKRETRFRERFSESRGRGHPVCPEAPGALEPGRLESEPFPGTDHPGPAKYWQCIFPEGRGGFSHGSNPGSAYAFVARTARRITIVRPIHNCQRPCRFSGIDVTTDDCEEDEEKTPSGAQASSSSVAILAQTSQKTAARPFPRTCPWQSCACIFLLPT